MSRRGRNSSALFCMRAVSNKTRIETGIATSWQLPDWRMRAVSNKTRIETALFVHYTAQD